ncbi:hypothetical protein RYZ27_08640 [Hyphomonas sp. FCG-A18]|uniref:hypothetical protein n=1 Tax=Hyphomonas sp. FCG-A18 TaxID=3080019 RepID=UPI002B31557A|nr:hypothetical protein RYZ27_08640 [Hyphomonas sp. FCG-A18]
MTVQWPQTTAAAFGNDLIYATHDLHKRDVFSDEGIIRILDEFPRDQLAIWKFGGHSEGLGESIRGQAPKASGAEIMEAVRSGKFWLNVRRSNLLLDYMAEIGQEIFGSLEDATGRKTRKQDMGLLISSPGIHVNYHLDIPIVALVQIRGEKTLWLYPNDDIHAPADQIEDIVHMRREEDLPFRDGFDDNAIKIDLKPGMALTWPQAAPHRVQNADCVNVSLSCEYMTLPALMKANAIYTNGILRSQFGMNPQTARKLTPMNMSKAVAAQALKKITRHKPINKSTPPTFELDLSAENYARPL